MNMKNDQFTSEFLLYCEIRFSLTMKLFEKFLDILESLECVLQSIFEMKIEIPSGSVWKMVLKLGKNLSKIGQIFTKLRMV